MAANRSGLKYGEGKEAI